MLIKPVNDMAQLDELQNTIGAPAGASMSADIAAAKTVLDTINSVIGTPKTLSAANDTVAQGFYAATTLHAVDADLAVGNIKHGVTVFGFTGNYDTEAVNPVAAGEMKTGQVGFVNGAKITGSGTQTLSAANDTVAAGYYAATTLAAVDTDLATANIKHGVTIFGIAGSYDTEAGTPVVAGEMKTGQIAFVNGAKVTGSGTKTLSTANDTVAAGYYEATTLSAVDTDLATGNIKHGVTIFGIAGSYDTEAVNPVVAGEMKTGQVGFVNGAKVTGSGTQTLSNANDTVTAGYYEATTLSAVDADLATANIKAGVTIFGVAGKTEVVDTTEAGDPAAAGDIANGKIAFVNGVKITGTHI